jgi:hypothetical protein
MCLQHLNPGEEIAAVITVNSKYTTRGVHMDLESIRKTGARLAIWVQHGLMLKG